MTVQTVTYRRLINTGNYENCAVEMTAAMGEGDPVLTATHELAWLVTQALAEILGENQLWRLGEEAAARLRPASTETDHEGIDSDEESRIPY
jgi:hypothetical protein